MRQKLLRYLKIFLINFILLYFCLYVLEIFLNYNKDKLFLKTRLYYLNSVQKKISDEKFYLNIGPYKFIDKKHKILPLSGYENASIFLCLDENNKPITFFSDENGFNNHYSFKNNDYLLIGDSYVQGMCVDKKNNLNSQFYKLSLKSTSMGVAGNGPLLEFATYKEFESLKNYKDVILFITIENDYWDLYHEKENKILINYLDNKDFKQNFSSYETKSLKKKILDDFFKNKTKRIFNDRLSVYHFNLKELGNLIENILKKESKLNTEYLNDKSLDILYFKILSNFKKISDQKNKNFFVVFNSISPDLFFPETKNEIILNEILTKNKLKQIKLYLKKNDIKFFDFNDFLLKNYKTKKDLEKIFKKINGRWDHYTEYGYYELVNQIKINLFNN